MADTATPTTEQARAGSYALSVFARVLSARVLRAHADGPLSSSELEARFGWAAKASLRVATANLCELGALARAEPARAHGALVTELTAAGSDLFVVAEALERWLACSPFGPLQLWDTAARGAVRAFVAGWDSAIISALAERPRSLSELSAEIEAHNYPALKRRMSKLRSTNLIAPLNGGRRSPAHTATPWLRSAVGPLSAASRWDRNHAPGKVEPTTRGEIEAPLLLALPLVELPAEASGECVLAAPASIGGGEETEPSLAAVSVTVEDGRPVSCSSGAMSAPRTWALGTHDAWLDAMVEGSRDALRMRGDDPEFADAVVEGIHHSLFPPCE